MISRKALIFITLLAEDEYICDAWDFSKKNNQIHEPLNFHRGRKLAQRTAT